jgi:glycerate dehydrogenase
MPKIIFLDAKPTGNLPQYDLIRQHGELILFMSTQPQDTAERVTHADIVITNKVQMGRKEIDAAPNLKLICVAATGMNNVDLEAAKERGIVVKNVVDYSTRSVAQHTFAMLLYLKERLRYFDEYIKSGDYVNSDTFTHLGPEYEEIAGKRFGIIGLGTIGKEVAKLADAFGAEVVYYSTSGKNNNATYQQVSLDELLHTSDVVSVHAPLNDNTRNLLHYDNMNLMKQTAILLNTGRGGIINEPDLVRILNESRIYGAGLDVLEVEPMPANHPFLAVQQKERLLVTPHIAWASKEARAALLARIAGNIGQFLKEGK